MRWIDYDNRKPTDAFPGWEPWSQDKWQQWLDESQRLLQHMSRLNTEAETMKISGDATAVEQKIQARNEVINHNGSHWGALKDWLLALSHGKCWFSDTKDLFSHYEVEHFRPKKIAKDLDGIDRDGYWWLAFDYSNFRICGNVGNRKKGGWFPLHKDSLLSTYTNQCEESEACFLLDPTDPVDVELIAYDEKGDAIPTPGISEWQRERVLVSIERLKLNSHEALTQARRSLWQKLTNEIDNYSEAMCRAGNGRNPGALGKLRVHSRNIREMLKSEAPLSSVARWCVFFKDQKPLLRLVSQG